MRSGRLAGWMIALSLGVAAGVDGSASAAEPPGWIDAEEPEQANAPDGTARKTRTRRAPPRRPRGTRKQRGTDAPRGEVVAIDAIPSPTFNTPPVVGLPDRRGKPVTAHKARDAVALGGWSRGLAEPQFVDPRRRAARGQPPPDFGPTLAPGEAFRFDVTFAGNPAGLAEAEIVAVEPDPRGAAPAGAPRIRIEGHARTSGVVSLLATVTDDIVTYVDARTGAAISSVNVLHYSGWAPRKYKHRVTEHAYEGRGQVRIVDTKDDKAKKKLKHVPLDTFDPMSAMAWVRSLRLEKDETASAHVVDGTTLMRIEITSGGRTHLDSMPSVGLAMGLSKDDTQRIDGRITRVDEYDQPIPGKRVFKLRAWLSDDERRVPLVMESDMWVGAIRLELSGYDPPHKTADPPRTKTDGPRKRAPDRSAAR